MSDPQSKDEIKAEDAKDEEVEDTTVEETVVEENFAFLVFKRILRVAWQIVQLCVWGYALYRGFNMAYKIRLFAIQDYGRVIHEFDPWFNFRATQYLADNGWDKFFKWYDYMAWYPLGRPVGTTIYPGMQITSVCIWKVLAWFPAEWKWAMSLNDVCCFVPAWFGVSASFFLGMLTYEATRSWASGACATLIMAIVPAHIMRSVGGGYDNESIALTAMCATFYFWVRSLRSDPKVHNGKPTRDSIVYGVITGLSYCYMVAAWGGFVFVLNLIGVHAACLVVLGQYSSKLHRAYTLFFIIGTFGATRVPVVGYNPFKSLEQLGPFAVFLVYQGLEYCEHCRRKDDLSVAQTFKLRVKVFTPAVAIVAVVIGMLLPTGWFGPLTARVRGLFVKHTRTGNPLVDSVAEHQPANEQAYQQYLHSTLYDLAPYGFVISFLRPTEGSSFLIAYAVCAYYFSSKMARLVVLLGPVASALGGVALGFLADQLLVGCVEALIPQKGWNPIKALFKKEEEDVEEEEPVAKQDFARIVKKSGGYKKVSSIWAVIMRVYNHPIFLIVRVAMFIYAIGYTNLLPRKYYYHKSHYKNTLRPKVKEFYKYSQQFAKQLSHPQIMFKANLQNGQEIIVDDYREAYWWLRDKTPADSRVMAWWDYGYQISGIGNRTTIADGNTWNHEHIALLGRTLSGAEKKAHRIARHLADYVLVWAGGGGDDLAKSPHMARIGNSVYDDICPGDPTCSQFGFYHGGEPTPMMRKSLLYKLTQFRIKGDVTLDPNRFQLAFESKYGKVRIFKVMHVSKESKSWVADPANRKCDAPGSWYCEGQYPPALGKVLAKRRSFSQLEDFNKKKDDKDTKYQEEYMARMSGKKPAPKAEAETPDEAEPPKKKKGPLSKLKYVGCYGGEAAFGAGRVYGGGSSGANLNGAREFARDKKMKYLAVAKVGMDGHSFAFNVNPGDIGKLDDAGCDKKCVDDSSFRCGCADAACGDGIKAVKGEEHVRRWVVYELPARKKKKKKGGN